MIPKIEIRLNNRCIAFFTLRRIKNLIRIIPEQYLIGLDNIIIVDEIKGKRLKKAGGIYREKYNNKQCAVEISISVIYKGMPSILVFFPFIAKFLLGNVLYHEIGHHNQKKFTHGIKKNSEEHFADNFCKKMMKRRFRLWLGILSPLSPIIKYLNKKRR